jgi:septal ring factor EnvC (AmiA/AmiB activator)
MATNPRATIGDNNPPDPIDLALEPYADILAEVEHWLDGETVKDAGQLKDTDKLLKELKAARKAVDVARDEYTKPLHEVWKAEVARWKPTQDDLDRQVKCLVSAQAPYKEQLAAEKERARLEAQRIADETAQKAREAAEQARSASIAEQRAADDLLAQAEEAKKQAARASKDTVKGMRTVQVYEIKDFKAALYWIAKNDKPAMTDFIAEYVRTHFKTGPIDGVKVETKKEAY